MSGLALEPLVRRATVLMGQSPPSAACSESGDGLPFIQGNAEFGFRHPVPCLRCAAPTRIAEPGDFLLSVRAPVGEVNQAEVRMVIGRGLSAIRVDEKAQPFLWHALKWSAPRLSQFAQGSTFVAVSRLDVESLLIPWGDEETCTGIAAILDVVDEAIAKTEAVIAKLKQVRAGLLHDLLTRGLDEHGQLRPPPTEAPHLYRNSVLGKIPQEWVVRSCQSLCREIIVGIVVKPAQYYVPDGVPALRSANIRENELQYSDLVYISQESNEVLAKSKIYEGDLLTVRTGYPGTTAVLPKALSGINCIDIIISRPSDEVLPEFLSRWINSSFGKDQVLRAQGGLAQQHFNVGEMRVLLVAKPPLREQQMIVEILTSHDIRNSLEYASLAKLKHLKSGLMADLLTDRVRVPAGDFE